MINNTKNRYEQNNIREPRINERIKALKVRVIIDGGGQPEVLERTEALRKAQEMGMDLVEISPNQDPPVCRIIDYGKYKFEQKKRKREQTRNQHQITTKEVKLRPKIANHDYELKVKHILGFLQRGDKVKVSVRFRGREITHAELGMDIMKRIVSDLKEHSTVELSAKMEGKQIILVLAPVASKPVKKEIAQKTSKLNAGENVSDLGALQS